MSSLWLTAQRLNKSSGERSDCLTAPHARSLKELLNDPTSNVLFTLIPIFTLINTICYLASTAWLSEAARQVQSTETGLLLHFIIFFSGAIVCLTSILMLIILIGLLVQCVQRCIRGFCQIVEIFHVETVTETGESTDQSSTEMAFVFSLSVMIYVCSTTKQIKSKFQEINWNSIQLSTNKIRDPSSNLHFVAMVLTPVMWIVFTPALGEFVMYGPGGNTRCGNDRLFWIAIFYGMGAIVEGILYLAYLIFREAYGLVRIYCTHLEGARKEAAEILYKSE